MGQPLAGNMEPLRVFPDFRENLESRSRMGAPIKSLFVVEGPKVSGSTFWILRASRLGIAIEVLGPGFRAQDLGIAMEAWNLIRALA